MMETFNLIYHLIFRFYNVAFFFSKKKKNHLGSNFWADKYI